jgi:hypothetical protein
VLSLLGNSDFYEVIFYFDGLDGGNPGFTLLFCSPIFFEIDGYCLNVVLF